MRNGRSSSKRQAYFGDTFAQKTYPTFLETSGQKTDLRSLIAGMLVSGGDIVTLVKDLHVARYSNGVAEADFDRRLFSPNTSDIRQLAAAILDAKEALPPFDLVPATKQELGNYLRRRMIATGEDVNIDVLVAGWSTGQSPGHDFSTHIDQLWQLRSENQYLYTALVSGRFGSVIQKLQQRSLTASETRRIRNLLVVQSLIWCAHDVQLVIARLDKTPSYGHLLPQNRSADGSLNDIRDLRAALSKAADDYFGSGDWRYRKIKPVGTGDRKPLTTHEDPTLRRLAKQIRGYETELLARVPPISINAMMEQIASNLRSDPFMARADTGRTQNVDAKSYAANWYGLSELAAASVPILRLVQAEQQLPAMIDEVIAAKTSPANTIFNPLPSFASVKLRHRSSDRLDGLLAFYREAVLKRADRNNNRAWKALKAASDFLRERGTRQLSDHHGPANDPRRAFYLLDVIPEHRFAVTCAFVGEK